MGVNLMMAMQQTWIVCQAVVVDGESGRKEQMLVTLSR